MKRKKLALEEAALSDHLYVEQAFAGIRDRHLLVFIYAGQHRPEFVDHVFRLYRAGRASERKIAAMSLIYDSTGLPDVATRQRYVEFADAFAGDTIGVATVVLASGFPATAHRAVLAQMNDQGRHGLPTRATETEEEALQWLQAQGVSKEDVRRMAELAEELRGHLTVH